MRSRLLGFVSFQQFHHRLAEGKANIHIDFAMAILVGVGGSAPFHGMGIDSGEKQVSCWWLFMAWFGLGCGCPAPPQVALIQ
jgi:hypothetical protein